MLKPVTATINGVSYPLCLTVAAMDELEIAGYHINDVSRLLSPGDDLTLEQLIKNIVWLLAIYIREGELNRHCCAEDGDEVRPVPTLDALSHILTPVEALALRVPLMEATVASISQTIQVDPEAMAKNGEGAAQA